MGSNSGMLAESSPRTPDSLRVVNYILSGQVGTLLATAVHRYGGGPETLKGLLAVRAVCIQAIQILSKSISVTERGGPLIQWEEGGGREEGGV